MKRTLILLSTGFLATAGAIVAGTGGLSAQVFRNHDSNAPVNFTADRIEVQDRADRVVVSGNVVVTKGDQTARGNVAIYDLNAKLITMLGNVALTQGANRLTGGRLVMDLNSGRSTVDGRSSGGGAGTSTSPSGRVSGTFTVPQRQN